MKRWAYFLIIRTVFSIVAGNQNLEDSVTTDVGGIIENTINSTLNKIKANLTDPISIASKTFDFGEGEDISGIFNVTSLKINGVKDFVAKEIQVDVVSKKININIVLTDLGTHFKYWADIVLLNLVPLYGRGRISVNFDEIVLNVQAAASAGEGPKIKDVVIFLFLNKATFDIKGLIDNPEYSALISNVLDDNFADFVNQNAKLISDTISPIMETVINSLLEPEKIRIKKMHISAKTTQ